MGVSNYDFFIFVSYIFLFVFVIVFLSSYYLSKPSNCIIIIIIIIIIITIMFIVITIIGILERLSGAEFQARNTSGRFRGAYRTCAASGVELFLILVSGFW